MFTCYYCINDTASQKQSRERPKLYCCTGLGNHAVVDETKHALKSNRLANLPKRGSLSFAQTSRPSSSIPPASSREVAQHTRPLTHRPSQLTHNNACAPACFRVEAPNCPSTHTRMQVCDSNLTGLPPISEEGIVSPPKHEKIFVMYSCPDRVRVLRQTRATPNTTLAPAEAGTSQGMSTVRHQS